MCRSPSTATDTPEALRLRGHPRWDATKGRQSPPQLVQRGAPRLVVTDILLRLPAAIAECELHGQGSSKTKPNWMNKSNSKHGIGRCNSQRNRAAVLFINWLAMRAVAQLTYSGTSLRH